MCSEFVQIFETPCLCSLVSCFKYLDQQTADSKYDDYTCRGKTNMQGWSDRPSCKTLLKQVVHTVRGGTCRKSESAHKPDSEGHIWVGSNHGFTNKLLARPDVHGHGASPQVFTT